MKDYRVVAKVKNNRIASRIEAAGYQSISAFCDKFDLHYSDVCALVGMTKRAISTKGQWLKGAVDLATALRVQPEELFNERQKAGGKAQVFIREIDDEVLSLEHTSISDRLLPSPDEAVTARIDVGHFMECLSPRERLAVEMTFGLDGQPSATLKEVGVQLGVGQERARQLIHQALRKMRHPARGGLAYQEQPRTAIKTPQSVPQLAETEVAESGVFWLQ